ncbi:MAG TPA: alpha/beta hydrolase [Jeotgalicoccus sp.]|nr:alpha/beta hydrolase [Jeotgalicoccus sp.]
MKKIIWTIVIVLLLILIGAGIYIYSLYNTFDEGVSSSYEPTDREKSDLREEDANVEDSFTVLILGTDENESRAEKENLGGDDFRTDSMILATFDKNSDDVKLVNIPRDTLAYIETEGYFDKINHAHMYGGPSASMDSVEKLLNVPVDYYVRINMAGVVDIVDSVGGVEFDVPFDMNEPNQHDKGRVELEAGVQELDGEEALAVVRSRRVDSDLGRGNRQMELVEAVLNKVKSSGGLSKIDDLIKVVADNTRHNFTSKDIRQLASYYAFNDISFDSTQLRGTDFWNPGNGAYFYRADDEHLFVLSNTIRDILEIEPSEPFDLLQLRLGDYLVPYEYLDEYMLTEHQPENIPFYAEEVYESPYGDGFETEEFDYEESDIEGEDDLEDTTDDEFNQDNQTPQNENSDEQLQEENYNNDGIYDDGTNNQQDGYYDDGTETQDEYYEGSNDDSLSNGYYY